jgi:hypothetical protein
MKPDAKSIIEYYLGQERFYLSFITQHGILHEANIAWKEGQLQKASSLISKASPESTLLTYSNLHESLEYTRGEEAMLISLNLRWLPDFVEQKQLSRVETIRYNFQPTRHDPLAQAPGKYSFFTDENGALWRGMGEAEVMNTKAISPDTTVSSTGEQFIVSREPFSIDLETWRGNPLSPGKYRAVFQLCKHPPAYLSLFFPAEDRITFRMEDGENYPDLVFDFETTGEPKQLFMDPHGSEIAISSLQIIPVKE